MQGGRKPTTQMKYNQWWAYAHPTFLQENKNEQNPSPNFHRW